MKSIAAYLLSGRKVILVALLSVFSLAGFATDRYVSASAGSDANSGLLHHPKKTIQAAINSANPGDKISVYPGDYSETAPSSTLSAASGGGTYQFGLFISPEKNGITIQGVDATGVPVSNYSSVVANVELKATNNFGPSGLFVEGDNVTITGLNLFEAAGNMNKTVEVLGENFTIKNCRLSDGYSLYINDWRYDATTNTSHITKYWIEGNSFEWGTSVDICSGAGKSGPVSGRKILNNYFDGGGADYWALVSFNGSGTPVSWFTYSVGGAEITGNTFTNALQYIRHRGILDESQFNWSQYWNENHFDKAVITLSNEFSFTPRNYSYTNGSGTTFANAKRIGAIIQDEITTIAQNGDLVKIGEGTYAENIIVNKEVAIRGTSQAETKIIPAISNPGCGGSASSLCGGSSNVMLVQANNVTIADLTIDGDNPALSSGIVRGGADIDARNGIITNHTLGIPFNNLTVNHVTVRNIYWRGIYASSAGGSFTIAENTVENVQGNPGYSIAIFNWQGSGYFTNNKVDNATDGIVSNWSTGTVYSGNTVTNSGSGIHTDNNGGAGGNADIIQNNLVKNSTAGGWGIWVFAPYLPVLVKDNTILNVDVGLSADAEWSPEIITFSGNTVDGQNKAGSYGAYFTTSTFWWGSTNLSVNFNNNTIVNNDYGIYLESEAGYNLSLAANNNSITSKYYNVSQATGAYGAGTFNVDMNCNWWGSAVGATINASIDGADVLHSSWLSNGTDIDAIVPGFQPAANICASPLSNVVVSAVTNADCYGASNGSAVITYQNGLPALSYTLNGGQATAIAGYPFTISGLAAGVYNATLTDAGGYTATVNFTITQPAAITASVSAAGADAFCNTVTLTAAPAALGDTYSWLLVGGSFTAATKEISLGQTNADGIYQVSVTTNGCTSQPGSFVFNKQYLISSYTLLAFDEIELGEKNTVAGGSVGVVSVKGKAAFHKNSSVAAMGSFVKAKNIKREGSNIQITNPIYEAAGGITLPALQINNSNAKNLPNKEVAQNSNSTVNGNYKNLTLKKGSNTIITGNIFGTIRVEQGASVRFTSTTINIDQLHVVQGTANGYSYVRFAPNTGVLVSGSVNIGSQVYVNPDNYKVTFYLADKKSDDEKFIVRGGDTKFTANIYIAKGKLKVTGGYGNDGEGKRDHDDDHHTGNGNGSVEMTGLFIAEKIASNGKNIIWNSFTCGALPVAVNYSAFVNQSVTEEKQNTTSEEALKVTILPNPSTTYFTLKIESRYQAPVELRIIDSRGRLVDAKSKIASNSTIQVGHNYSSGTYFAEMIQGTRRKVVQLIKGKE